MTVKEYLGQAYLLDKRIKSDSMELDELRLMAETISSPGFEEHYNASKNTDAPYIKTLERIFDMESKILEEMNLLMALKSDKRCNKPSRKARISDDFEVSIHPQYDMAKNRRYALCR